PTAVLLFSAACSPSFDGKVPCDTDFSCPTAFHCVAGKCVSGNGPPLISWSSPDGATPIGGTQTFSVKVSHPDGVTSIKLAAGSKELKTITKDKSFGTTGPTQVDFSVDT